MRFLIVLAPDLAIVLEQLAKRDHRPVRLEAEWLLAQALRSEVKDPLLDREADALESIYAPAQI